jgi:hypothetical protein
MRQKRTDFQAPTKVAKKERAAAFAVAALLANQPITTPW